MSVRTTADEHLDSAKQHIKDAVKDLSEIVVEQCWGHDEYREEYSEELKRIFRELLEIRDRIRA